MHVLRGTILRRRLRRGLIWAVVVLLLASTAGLWVLSCRGNRYAAWHERKLSSTELASTQICFRDWQIAFIEQTQTMQPQGRAPLVNWRPAWPWGFSQLYAAPAPTPPPTTAPATGFRVSSHFIWPTIEDPIVWGTNSYPRTTSYVLPGAYVTFDQSWTVIPAWLPFAVVLAISATVVGFLLEPPRFASTKRGFEPLVAAALPPPLPPPPPPTAPVRWAKAVGAGRSLR
jgi:hypothetical protein